MQYIIKLTPLEPYFLGGERNYNYLGIGDKKYNYYIKSEIVPSQTTLFGVLRFSILQLNNLIKTDFDYKSGEIEKYIGSNSFSYDNIENQKFGQIDSIGPMFLIDENNRKYIRTPYNSNNEGKYEPYKMMESEGYSSLGEGVLFPYGYDPKKGIIRGYMELESFNIISEYELFKPELKTRIHKKLGKENTEAYFKKELIALKKGFSFAFYAKINSDKYVNKKSIVYMGQDKSAFSISFDRVDDEYYFYKDIEIKLNDYLKLRGNNLSFEYALSDIKINEELEHRNSAIIETKTSKPIKTKIKKELEGRYSLSTRLHNLISSGSVFFYNLSEERTVNTKYRKIGLNYLVKIKGGTNEV